MVRESLVEERKSGLRGVGSLARAVSAGAAVVAACALVACSDDEGSDLSNVTPDSGAANKDSGTPPGTDAGEPDDETKDAGPDSGDVEELDPTSCRITPTAGSGDTVVELCKPAQGGTVKHVTIAGLQTPAVHASASIVFGFDEAPTSAQGPIEPDQFRVLFYGGGSPAPPALIGATFGSFSETLEGNASFLNTAPSTVCFDVHDGGTTTAPYFALWVTGQKGADCADRSTLTVASAWGIRANWKGATGAIDKAAKAFYRQAAGLPLPTITVSTTPALTADALAAAVDCTTAWQTNTDWQGLCAPAAGAARHVRIEGAATTANNGYWYAVLGQDPNPAGPPAVGAGKLIVTAGQSSSGASWTYFRFGATAGSNSTTQFNYATDAEAPLYTSGPTTVCFDLGQSGANQRFVFWATGAKGADCTKRATLTTTSALYDSTTDASTGAIWSGLLATGKQNFIKTNNATVSLVKAVVSSEPAAL